MADALNPLVTVVIPCYKQAHFLSHAIDSALAQPYPHVEVIVVNDGSPDDTSAVARSYGDRVLLIEQQNTGLSGARNAGILRSHAQFIALLDSDDALHPECVAWRLAMLLAEPEAGLVTGNVRFVDESLRPIAGRTAFAPATDSPRTGDVLRGNVGPTCGMILRRRALELCGLFDPLLRSCEDWDATLRISTRFKILVDPRPLADLREVPGSMSRGHTAMWDTARAVMRKNRAYAPSGWRFFLDSRVGLFYHLLLMMNRVRFEETGWRRFGVMARFGATRPSAIPYFVLWGMRFAWNTLRRRPR